MAGGVGLKNHNILCTNPSIWGVWGAMPTASVVSRRVSNRPETDMRKHDMPAVRVPTRHAQRPRSARRGLASLKQQLRSMGEELAVVAV